VGLFVVLLVVLLSGASAGSAPKHSFGSSSVDSHTALPCVDTNGWETKTGQHLDCEYYADHYCTGGLVNSGDEWSQGE
jgi:hypothetical protein